MAGHVVEAEESTFANEVKSEMPVVIDFWAEWCMPCKRLTPVIEEIATEMSGKVKFIKVNVDTNQEVASRYEVMSIPTLVFSKQGQEVDRMVGAAGKESLAKKINSVFGI